MANNKNNADGSLYSYGKNPSHSTDPDHDKKILAIATVVFIVVVLLIWWLCFCFHKDSDEEDAVAGVGNRARQRRQSSEADRTSPPTVAAAAMEVVTAELQLVCTYRMADDWRDSSCGVCLADLADGDVLRVLPLCMHYFHAACVGEWLRGHDTCPLCRASLVAPAAAA